MDLSKKNKMDKFEVMKESWNQISLQIDGNIPPSFELEVYKKLLHLFHVGSYYYYIFNVASVEMEFVSDNIKNVIGFESKEFSAKFVFDQMHSEDRDRFVVHEQKVTEFFEQLPPEKVLKYKVSYDYRLKCADGSYKWILMQTTTLQTNPDGAVIRVLGVHTDISHLKTDHRPSGLSFLGLDGEPSYLNVPIQSTGFVSDKEVFTKREKEILQLIMNGFTSAQIAENLFISIQTVHSHRKNILFKSGCKTPAELIAKALANNYI